MTPRHPDGLAMTEKLWRLGDLPPCRVLDMGAGAGESLGWLSARGCDAVGVDLAGGPVVRQADLRQTPFAEASFGAVMAECVFSVCGDAAAAFAEAFRLLKKGGRLLLSDVYFQRQAPELSLGRPATRENWQALAREAGFAPLAFVDESAAWRQYWLELLWADAPACETYAAYAGSGCGYFLMACERK